MSNEDTLTGWTAICEYLGLTRHVIIQRGYPVFALPYGQSVWASRKELDAHTAALKAASLRVAGGKHG